MSVLYMLYCRVYVLVLIVCISGLCVCVVLLLYPMYSVTLDCSLSLVQVLVRVEISVFGGGPPLFLVPPPPREQPRWPR